ncbi:MAG: hypothetical protein GXX90_03150 [Microbacteriaceae bacterium]|nr:hypothetical protein [Microbacteriaceae bacterium]
MVEPKWLALLVGVLVTVAAFGWLGWWQLTSAFDSALPPEDAEAYETAVPLGELIAPGDGLVESAAARPVTATGWLDLREPIAVAERVQGEEVGYWLVGRFVVADAGAGSLVNAPAEGADGAATVASVLPSAPVAVAWAADRDAALAAGERLAAELPALPGPYAAASAGAALGAGAYELGAQLQPGQDPRVVRDHPAERSVEAMSPGQLINLWGEPSPGYYSAYLVADEAFGAALPEGAALPDGVEAIDVVPVDQSLQLNLLNIFYAIEWAIFIVMAFYIWWRLVRDDHDARVARAEGADERLAAEIRREKLRELAARRAPAAPPASDFDSRPRDAGTEDR